MISTCYQRQQLNLFWALFGLNTSWPRIIYYRALFLRCFSLLCSFHWWLCFMNYRQVLSSALLLLYQPALWILLLPSNFFSGASRVGKITATYFLHLSQPNQGVTSLLSLWLIFLLDVVDIFIFFLCLLIIFIGYWHCDSYVVEHLDLGEVTF